MMMTGVCHKRNDDDDDDSDDNDNDDDADDGDQDEDEDDADDGDDDDDNDNDGGLKVSAQRLVLEEKLPGRNCFRRKLVASAIMFISCSSFNQTLCRRGAVRRSETSGCHLERHRRTADRRLCFIVAPSWLQQC